MLRCPIEWCEPAPTSVSRMRRGSTFPSDALWYLEDDSVLCSLRRMSCVCHIWTKSHTNTRHISSLYPPTYHQHGEHPTLIISPSLFNLANRLYIAAFPRRRDSQNLSTAATPSDFPLNGISGKLFPDHIKMTIYS